MPQPAERVSRGHERIRAPLFTSALEPTSAACAWAREANEGRAGFVSLGTHARSSTPVEPQSGVKDKQVKSRQDWKKNIVRYCNGRTFASLDLRLASSFFSFFPAASMFHLARVRIAHATEPSSHTYLLSIVYGTVLVTSQVMSIRKGSHQAARRIHINTCPFACTRPRIRIRHWITRPWSQPLTAGRPGARSDPGNGHTPYRGRRNVRAGGGRAGRRAPPEPAPGPGQTKRETARSWPGVEYSRGSRR